MSAVTEYDIVFAGGGTAGCLIAGRLSAANPSLRILVLEAGEHTFGKAAHIQPARYFSHLVPTSTTVSFNVSKPSPHVNGRSLITPSARCVGGGSSINFAMYTRASASDYDDWENVHGNPGWGSKDLIPLLEKTETYQVKPNAATHGYSGPLKVSYGGAYTNIGKQFLEVAGNYDTERSVTEDINDLKSSNAYGRWAKFIDGETGRRSDVPHHFIYNQAHNTNLQVITACRVKRIVFEGNRAVGVEYVSDTVLHPDSDQTVHFVRASRLVVVSAGAFGSPTILERSGIGKASVLLKHDVDVRVDLPGVGENYRDHNVGMVTYLASEDADTLDGIFRGDKTDEDKYLKLWDETGQGLIAHNGIDSGAKIRPTARELQDLGADFETQWKTYFEHAPDKPVLWVGPIAVFVGDFSVIPPRKYYTLAYYTEYPVSVGSVHITSGEDANAPCDFDANFLNDPADVAALRWGYKKSRELSRRLGVYRGEHAPGHPAFAQTSSALCGDHLGPVDIAAPDFTYTEADNKAIDDYHRNNVATTWHSLGTCAMKPQTEGGVVDSRLNVYGVVGLKVAVPKISIAPSNVGANTYSTALVIGEKAAMLIAEDLGLQMP